MITLIVLYVLSLVYILIMAIIGANRQKGEDKWLLLFLLIAAAIVAGMSIGFITFRLDHNSTPPQYEKIQEPLYKKL